MVSVGFESQVLRFEIQDVMFKGSIEGNALHQNPSAMDATLLALSLTRIVVFVAMIFIFWLPQLSCARSSSVEADPLLPDGVTRYSSTYGTNATVRLTGGNMTVGKPKDAQENEWTDYVIGFKQLFPFLWYARQHFVTNYLLQRTA